MENEIDPRRIKRSVARPESVGFRRHRMILTRRPVNPIAIVSPMRVIMSLRDPARWLCYPLVNTE